MAAVVAKELDYVIAVEVITLLSQTWEHLTVGLKVIKMPWLVALIVLETPYKIKGLYLENFKGVILSKFSPHPVTLGKYWVFADFRPIIHTKLILCAIIFLSLLLVTAGRVCHQIFFCVFCICMW